MSPEQKELVEQYLKCLATHTHTNALKGTWVLVPKLSEAYPIAVVLASVQLAEVEHIDTDRFAQARLTLDMDDPWVLEQLWALGGAP